MRRIAVFLFTATFFVACSSVRLIPAETMVRIITDALLSESIARLESDSDRFSGDSLDIYNEIIIREGYTLADFEYTVRELGVRKSNPMNNILKLVVEDIDRKYNITEVRYRQAMAFDSTAQAYYRDTIYERDTTIRGSLKRFDIELLGADAGVYRVMFDYQSVADYTVGSKSIHYKASGGTAQHENSILWISRSIPPAIFDQSIVLNHSYDSLKLAFVEPSLVGSRTKQDTSYISNIRIIYTPSAARARHRYFELRTGGIGKSLFDLYNGLYISPDKADSLPVPFISRGRI